MILSMQSVVLAILCCALLFLELPLVSYGQTKEKDQKKEEKIELHAQAAVLIDAENGRVLYGKDETKELPMASTTKIMTCIIALEQGNLEDVVEVSSYAASMPDVQLNIKKGEQYKLKDLLYSLMLESHNDSAVAIAEHIGGSVEGFAALMNQKAADLGVYHTHFVTPNGLDAEGHYTTAVDLARIGAYAIQNDTFLEITNTPSHSFSDVKGKRKFQVNNKDAFLTMMEGAVGIKTGFTGKAGYCFVGAIKRKDKCLVSAVLASGWPPHKKYKWADTKKLMQYGVDNYERKNIFQYKDSFPAIPVEQGVEDKVSLEMEQGKLEMLLSKQDNVKVTYQWEEKLQAPVARGQKVGSADYWVNGEKQASFSIYTTHEVPKISLVWCLRNLWQKYLL